VSVSVVGIKEHPYVVQDDDADADVAAVLGTDSTNTEDARTMPGWDARVSRIVVVVS